MRASDRYVRPAFGDDLVVPEVAAEPRRRVLRVEVRRIAGMGIGRVIDSIGADLLVVGASTGGVLSRALFGSTAARLLRESRVPLLAVPEAATATMQEGSASLQAAA